MIFQRIKETAAEISQVIVVPETLMNALPTEIEHVYRFPSFFQLLAELSRCCFHKLFSRYSPGKTEAVDYRDVASESPKNGKVFGRSRKFPASLPSPLSS